MWSHILLWVTFVWADTVAQADFHRYRKFQLSTAAEQITPKFNRTKQQTFYYAQGFYGSKI